MKITVLNGALSTYSHGLHKALKTITQTLSELGVTVADIPLAYSQIPYFDGVSSQGVEAAMQSIRESEGLILATSVSLFAPSALTQTFLEYFDAPENRDVLRDKHCFLLAVSGGYGEARALEYLVRAINSLGGYDSARLGLTAAHLAEKQENENSSAFSVIERAVEDYYRIVRQNRKLIIPKDYAAGTSPAVTALNERIQAEPKAKVALSDVYQKLDLGSFTEQQEQDIQEITELLAKRYTEVGAEEQEFTESLRKTVTRKPVIKPRAKTCRQMTQSLPHYYQPQMAGGLTATLQLNITGSDPFECHLIIGDGECAYLEGPAENPDITILSDAAVWTDVIKGKQTAQKAFMIGRVKVRGNFVLLTKFEQLFKPVV